MALLFGIQKTKTFNIAVNSGTGKLNQDADNYDNVIVSFVHEKVHKDDPKTKEPLFHVNAIIAEANSKYLEGTTDNFKAGLGIDAPIIIKSYTKKKT